MDGWMRMDGWMDDVFILKHVAAEEGIDWNKERTNERRGWGLYRQKEAQKSISFLLLLWL
jgi:hypothetical protein